jgi:hypothetical protein
LKEELAYNGLAPSGQTDEFLFGSVPPFAAGALKEGTPGAAMIE